MRKLVVPALVLAMLGGCATANDPAGDLDEAVPAPVPDHALDGTVEPEDLLAPTFDLLGALASGGPVYGAGEPSIWAALDGTITVAFPGCDRGFYLVTLAGQEDCGHGLVYRSGDDGATWDRLNRDGDGRYTDDGPGANGDADVAVDAAGNLYASNLGGGIQVHRMLAGSQEWEYMANVVPEDEGADRQWMAAAAEGQLVMTWMRTSPQRDVAINVTLDGGQTWLGEVNFGTRIGWLGTVQFGPDNRTAYIPYTQPQAGLGLGVGGDTFAMHVVRTLDGGRTWEDIDTGMRWRGTVSGGHWSGGHMAPTLDVTGDGTVVVAMSIDDWALLPGDPPAVTNQGTTIVLSTSRDNGTTWSPQQPVAGAYALAGGSFNGGSAIMPWITGGAGDRFAITYLYTISPADNDYAGATWDVRAAHFDGATEGKLEMVETTVEANVHQGGVCTRGGLCLLTGSDRALLDFFEADVTPDGRLVVTYPADPLTGGKHIEIRTAIQSGGTLLLERP